MINNKVELLAPAGDFACFRAAINAGADAVYLGGDKFGARAYANNFTEDEILEALRLAHLFNKKIYLTVNTLVKEKEISETKSISRDGSKETKEIILVVLLLFCLLQLIMLY